VIVSIPQKYPHFNRWYLEMSQLPEVAQNDQTMKKVGKLVQKKRKELEEKRQEIFGKKGPKL
jgi:hypothetical protein